MKEYLAKPEMNDNDDIGNLLRTINDNLEKSFNAFLATSDITFAQLRVLFYLHYCPAGTTTQKILEVEFDVSHPTINGILKRMQNKGLVTTEITVEKRLTKLVKITKAGEAKLKKTNSSKALMEKALTGNISEAQQKTLKTLLKKLLVSLNEAKL